MDENHGDGCGALNERSKLNTIIEQWEQQQQSAENATITTGENNNNKNLEEDKSELTNENEDKNLEEDKSDLTKTKTRKIIRIIGMYQRLL